MKIGCLVTLRLKHQMTGLFGIKWGIIVNLVIWILD